MTFAPTELGAILIEEMRDFMAIEVLPAEAEYHQYRNEVGPFDHTLPPVVERLKQSAKARGLWNTFLPAESGIGQLDYSYLAELSSWSMHLGPEAINGQAPDTGNMELLHLFGTPGQQKEWLAPLLAGEVRSAFAMTEPAVASSDAMNIETRIERVGDTYVINGRKWWTSGLADPRCQILIVMGKNDIDAPRHRQQSMILVPRDTPGVRVVRDVPVFGRHDQHGHCEVEFTDVRVPAANLLGAEGEGFAMAQARLGPGRIHHCMRALGVAERALALTISRARDRQAFGGALLDRETIQASIARSRIDIDQARLLCQHTAAVIDAHDNKAAATLVSQMKLVAPRVATRVIDEAIQVHGGAGVSDDTFLAEMYGWHRAMRLFDGPDEVHLRTVARTEIRRKPTFEEPSR